MPTASSSRSQVAAPTASAGARLTWEAPSVDVRWRPLLAVAIVTHFVTPLLASRCREEPLIEMMDRRPGPRPREIGRLMTAADIPPYHALLEPALQAVFSLGGSASISEIVETVIKREGFS